MAATKDSHSAALLPARQQPLLCSSVRVFGPGDPPKLLRDTHGNPISLEKWDADDRVHRGEAKLLNTSKKCRGIQVAERIKTPKAAPKAHTLQDQLQGLKMELAEPAIQEWEKAEAYELTLQDLARIDQVEGLPVVGDPYKLFRGKKLKEAA